MPYPGICVINLGHQEHSVNIEFTLECRVSFQQNTIKNMSQNRCRSGIIFEIPEGLAIVWQKQRIKFSLKGVNIIYIR